MQQDDIKQDDDANAHASRSHDKPMNDKHDDARRMAEQLIAEEGHAPRGSAVSTYLVAAIIGLIIWAAIYYLWRSL
jgi:hypothetical protein